MAASLALHGAAAAAVLWWAPPAAQLEVPPLPAPVQLMNLARDRSGEMVDTPSGAPDCSHGKLYEGVGIQFDLNEVVITSPESYPAFKAGIRVGDTLLNPEFEPDAAGYVDVEFARHGKRHHVRIKTQWICLR